MTRLGLVVASALAVLAVAAPAPAATAQLPSPPLAGTRGCAPAPFVRALREKGTTCHRARQISHFWETHGRCPGGWREHRYALPSGVEATGGSYLSCRRSRAQVFWAEHGE
jgi:hypothetical protein